MVFSATFDEVMIGSDAVDLNLVAQDCGAPLAYRFHDRYTHARSRQYVSSEPNHGGVLILPDDACPVVGSKCRDCLPDGVLGRG
jgi:hypothetical protein